jgi:ribosomal protein S18 acetylase RimI-like enzyme
MTVHLRPMLPEDEAFSFAVYASTRVEEMARVPWNAAQKQAFLEMQFSAQRQSYLTTYPKAMWSIIMQAESPVGREIVDRGEGVLLLIDIALLPQYRDQGIGTALIQDLMAEVRRTGQIMRLHVEFFNPALRLYQRLGFAKMSDLGIYWEMEWNPRQENKAEGGTAMASKTPTSTI